MKFYVKKKTINETKKINEWGRKNVDRISYMDWSNYHMMKIFKSILKRKEFKLRDYITANFNGNEICCKEHTWGCRSLNYYVARTMKIKPENTTSWRKKEKVVFITKFFWLKFISFKISIFKRLTKNAPM